jgi:hypothetical protein
MRIWPAFVPMVPLYESPIQNFIFCRYFWWQREWWEKSNKLSCKPEYKGASYFSNENIGKGFPLIKVNLSFTFECCKQKGVEFILLRNNKFKIECFCRHFHKYHHNYQPEIPCRRRPLIFLFNLFKIQRNCRPWLGVFQKVRHRKT